MRFAQKILRRVVWQVQCLPEIVSLPCSSATDARPSRQVHRPSKPRTAAPEAFRVRQARMRSVAFAVGSDQVSWASGVCLGAPTVLNPGNEAN